MQPHSLISDYNWIQRVLVMEGMEMPGEEERDGFLSLVQKFGGAWLRPWSALRGLQRQNG